MRDVGERAAVHEGRRVLERLYEIGLERVFEQGRHGALGLELGGAHRAPVVGVAHHDLAQTVLEVGDGGGQAQDGHDLGGDGDVEAVLAGHALGAPAEAVHDMAQLAVVHVHGALPGDALGIDAEGVALLDVVVEHRREQVVGGADGVEVAREVQVDVLHGDDLGVAAARRASLDAEHRAERRLAQRHRALDAAAAQAVGQADRRGGLSLARRGGVDGGDQHQLGVVVRRLVQQRVVDFGLVESVRDDVLPIDACFASDLGDGKRLDGMCNLDV